MNDLYLITFASAKHNDGITERHKELLDLLQSRYSVNLVNIRNIEHIPSDGFKLVFMTSPYVEQQVAMHYEMLPHPLLLLADGANNSLPAAMQVKAWANSQSVKARILYGGDTAVLDEIDVLQRAHAALHRLQGQKIGVIGSPCNWQISSSVNYLLAKRRWGVEYSDISLDELAEAFNATSIDDVGEISAELAGNAKACIEATPEDLLKDMRLFMALKRIVQSRRLSALAINNNKIFDELGTSTCVALSMLNDEGIPSCGGTDLQSSFTALVLKELTGEVAFTGNVSAIDFRNNSVTLSCCAVGTKFVGGDYSLRSHYERGKSIAIQGNMPSGKKVTIAKCGGESLDIFFAAPGTTAGNDFKEGCCRTQVKVALGTPVSYFINNPIGNHHLLIRGSHERLIAGFFENSSTRMLNMRSQDINP